MLHESLIEYIKVLIPHILPPNEIYSLVIKEIDILQKLSG